MNGIAKTFWAAVSAFCLARAKALLDGSERWRRRHAAAEKKARR